MESQQHSYRHEIRRLYRLMESTSMQYLSVDHLRELGIEATQVELTDGKLQFNTWFFQPQHHNHHESYPLLDETQKLRELTFRLSWNRCLRQATDDMAKLIRTGHWSAEDLKFGEDRLFRIARNRYLPGLWYERSANVGDRSQKTLLYVQQLLGADRVNPDLPPQEVPFHLSDLSSLTE
jgi:hypothetical protein